MPALTLDLFGTIEEKQTIEERIMQHGIKGLGERELIEGLISPYISKKVDTRKLAETILEAMDRNSAPSLDELKAIHGVSEELASGILIALELGREVFAVPGNINSAMSKGTNRLIRSAQGACVLSFEDIVCTFRENVVKSPSVSNLQFSVEDQLILKHLENGEKTIEQLVELTGFQIGKLNANLTMLEIRGVVKQLPGNSYILV